MPVLNCRAPRLCYLPSRGVAVVFLGGKRVTVGPWPEHPKKPSPSIQARYRALIATAGQDGPLVAPNRPTVAVLVDRITDWSGVYYQGQPKEHHAIITACEMLMAVVGKATLVGDLTPAHIVAVRESLASTRTRQGVNKVLGYVRRILRRGCELGIVPAATLTGCMVVQGLRPGRTSAPEAVRREGVPNEVLEKTLPFLSPQIRAMVQLQRVTGMRPNELVRMTWDQIDQSRPVWVYRPTRHKCAWRGQSREIHLGAKAQAILSDWRSLDGLPVFNPRRDWGNIIPMWKRAPGQEWRISSYRHAVARACAKAGVAHWSPQDLRKAAAQEIREEFGLEFAAAALGHSVEVNDRHYSTHSRKAAIEVAQKLG